MFTSQLRTPQRPSATTPFTPRHAPAATATTPAAATPVTRASAAPVVLEHTSRHRIDKIGPLPSPVRDLLVDERTASSLSAACASSIAWVVASSGIYVWSLSPSSLTASSSRNPACRHIPLAPERLPCDARACCAVELNGVTALAAASGQHGGGLTFWPDVWKDAHVHEPLSEGVHQLSLCVNNTLIAMSPSGSATLISIMYSDGRLLVRPLERPRSMLTSVFDSVFGSGGGARTPSGGRNPLEHGGSAHGMPLAALGHSLVNEQDVRELFVLRDGHKLEKWHVTGAREDVAVRGGGFTPAMRGQAASAEFVLECDLRRLVMDRLLEEEENKSLELTVWLLDLQWSPSAGLVVLAASIVDTPDAIVVYSLVQAHSGATAPPIHGSASSRALVLGDITNLAHSPDYDPLHLDQLLGWRLCLAHSSLAAFVYSVDSVIMSAVAAAADDLPLDMLTLRANDTLLGLSSSSNTTVSLSSSSSSIVAVSARMGVVRVSQPDLDQDTVAPAPASPPTTTSLATTAIPAGATTTTTAASLDAREQREQQLVAAFTARCNGDTRAGHTVTQLLQATPATDVSSAIVHLSSFCVLDAFPGADPRWAESGLFGPMHAAMVDQSLGTSDVASVILMRQLQVKHRRHQVLLELVDTLALWPVLDASARARLCVHAQQLAVALALREYQSTLAHDDTTRVLLEGAMRRCLETRHIAPNRWMGTGLGAQDVFYREVSRIESLVSALLVEHAHLAKLQQQQQHRHDQPQDRPMQLLSALNGTTTAMLAAAQGYSAAHRSTYHLDENITSAHGGARGVVPSLLANATVRQTLDAQHSLTLTAVRAHPGDAALLKQLYTLGDLYLAGFDEELAWQQQHESVGASSALHQQFSEVCSTVITPFAQMVHQRERAFDLAERYRHFATLVQLCTGEPDRVDTVRLDSYMDMFAAQGFAEFLFRWYLAHDRRRELLSQPPRHHDTLTAFLRAHPSLAWLHDLQRGAYGGAHATLVAEATRESASLAKKKTLLSIAKLSLLSSTRDQEDTSDVASAIDHIDTLLYLVKSQERLPDVPAVTSAMRTVPLSADNLVRAYTSVGNDWAHFVVALEVLSRTQTSRAHDTTATLLEGIWSAAVACNADAWDALAADIEEHTLDDTTLHARLAKTVFGATVANVMHAWDSDSVRALLPSPVSLVASKALASRLVRPRTVQRLLESALTLTQ